MKWYFIGLIVAWIIFKVVRLLDKDSSWEGIWYSLVISLMSWIGVISGIAVLISQLLPGKNWEAKIGAFSQKILNKLQNKKPPRWL